MLTHVWPLIVGLVAAGLPVFIHWLTRPKPVRMPISTLRFIRGAVQQKRARYRLRDLTVFLLRTAAILLFALSLARPLLMQKAVAQSDDEPAAIVRVVILDCSQSLSARGGGISHFERARPMALEAVKYQSSMKANLLLAAATPNPVFDTTSANFGALRDALKEAIVRPERLRVQPALNLAAEMLAQAGNGTRLELVVVSDFQRSNWATADFSVLPEDCVIQLKSVTDEGEIPNLAVTGISTVGRVEAGQESEFVVEVVNFSSTPRHVRVELSVGQVVVPVEGHVPARAKGSLGGRIPTTGTGWQTGTAQIMGQDDAFPLDNVRAFAIAIHPRPAIGFLTREDRKSIASSAYFLERALLSTRVSATDSQLPVWIDAAEPDVELLRTTDVVIVARPGRLSQQTINVLAAMLQRGTSLLYVAADALDAANLKDLSEVLGASARLPVEYVPMPVGRGGDSRTLTDVDRRQPPFSIFGDELAAAIRSLEFHGGLISRSVPDGIEEDIRGTFSDQSAFLTVTSTGRGQLAVMNVDLERSNLARTPILVPLLSELISQELSRGEQIDQIIESGETFALTLPVGEERIEDLNIVGPSGVDLDDRSRGRLLVTPAGVVWEVQRAGSPGIYRVELEGKPVVAVATSIPVDESDLRLLPPQVFEDRLSGGRKMTYQSNMSINAEDRDTLWSWLAVGCLLCVLGELLTLKWFRV